MPKKLKSERDAIEADIIEFLMMADSEQTASQIAKAIGLRKAKDVNNHLTALNNKQIVEKIKSNRNVFWTVEQTPAQIGIPATESKFSCKFTNRTPKPNQNLSTPTCVNNDVPGGRKELIALINSMKSDIQLLQTKVTNLERIIIQKGSVDSLPCADADVITKSTKDTLREEILSPVSSSCAIVDGRTWSPDNDCANESLPVFSQSSSPTKNNRFAPLASIANDSHDVTDADTGNRSGCLLPKIQILKRQPYVPIVPGIQSYSNVHENLISVVTDSMSNGIRQREFNQKLLKGRAVFKKFSGATAPEINDYSKTTIRKDRPRGLLVIAGANDCSYKSKNNQIPNIEEIANDVINIGLEARKLGVKNIFISGLITRKGLKLEMIRREVNHSLYDKCLHNNFYYVDNDNIGVDNLWEDGLHLNNDGAAIFQNNLLRCFDESLYIF